MKGTLYYIHHLMLQPLHIIYSHTEWDVNEKTAPNFLHGTRLGQMCLGIGTRCLPPANPLQSNILACLGIAIGH